MEHFERVLPGLADRITAMAEGHAKNRWNNDRATRVTAILGQVFAFVVAMTLIGGGFYLTIIGRPTEGLSTIGVTIAAIVGAFVYGRRSKREGDGH